MTDRTERGTGSLGDDDTELNRTTPGSTELSGSQGTTAASGGNLDMGTGAIGSGMARGSTLDADDRSMDGTMSTSGTTGMDDLNPSSTMGSSSTMGVDDLSIDSTLGTSGTMGTSDVTMSESVTTVDADVYASGAEVSETPDRATTGEATGGGGGLSGALPGAAIGALAGAALGAAASALLGGGDSDKSSHIEDSIEVDAPVSVVYNQWTQFEEFPRFMEGVERVQQLDDKRLHWQADIGFKDKEWDAEIVDQVPDQRVAWRSTSGAPNGGVVTFQPLAADRTRVTLRLDYAPEGVVENVGDTLGLVSRRVKGDLERFKQFIEARGTETGGWRGQI